jgi:integrase
MPLGKTDHIIFDSDMPGLGVRLRGNDRRWTASFLVQYRFGGRQRRASLGDIRKVKIEDARKAAQKYFAKRALGIDLTAELAKEQARARHTLGHIADLYLGAKQKDQRPNTHKAVKRHLEQHWRPLRSRPIDEVTRVDVAFQLRELVKTRGPRAASAARDSLRALYTWAIGEGLAEKNPVAGTNDPAKKPKGQPAGRTRSPDENELKAIWMACGDDDYGRIVRLAILLGGRRQELGGLRRSEFDPATGTLLIPAWRIKTHKDLVLTLPPAALEILAPIPEREGRDHYFGRSGKEGFAGWSAAKRALDARIAANIGKALPPWVLHDLRRAMRTGLGRLGIRPDVAERCVGHGRGKIEEIYDTHKYAPEIAQALARWADHVLALAEGRQQGGKVVPIRA